MEHLIRITEPELMTGDAQCHQFHTNHSRLRVKKFANWILTHTQLHGQGIDLGSGPGMLDIMLCNQCNDIQINGIEGSWPMIAIAENSVRASGLHARIKYQHSTIQQAQGKYDFIVCSDTLHHIHDHNDFWQAIKRLSGKNCDVFVCDLVRPKSEEELIRIVKVITRGQDQVYVDDFRNSLRAAFTLDELSDQLSSNGLTNFCMHVHGDVCQTVYIHGKG